MGRAYNTLPKPEGIAILRRAGVPAEPIEAPSAELDEEIDLDRDGATLSRYGISRDTFLTTGRQPVTNGSSDQTVLPPSTAYTAPVM
jgi:hypothetical protein